MTDGENEAELQELKTEPEYVQKRVKEAIAKKLALHSPKSDWGLRPSKMMMAISFLTKTIVRLI